MKIKFITIIIMIALMLSIGCITSNAFNTSNIWQMDENYITDFFSDPKVTHIDGTPLDEEIVFSLREIEDELIKTQFAKDNMKIYEIVFENSDGETEINEPLSYAVAIFDSILDFTGSDKIYEVYELDREHNMTPTEFKLNETYVTFNLENNYGFVIREITPSTTDSETENTDSENSNKGTDSGSSDNSTNTEDSDDNTDDEDFIIIDKDTDSSTDTSSDSTDTDSDEEALLGDVDLNEKINMEDVVHLQRAVAKMVVLNNKQVTNADVNFDEQCNMEDVTLIQKFIAQLIFNFK